MSPDPVRVDLWYNILEYGVDIETDRLVTNGQRQFMVRVCVRTGTEYPDHLNGLDAHCDLDQNHKIARVGSLCLQQEPENVQTLLPRSEVTTPGRGSRGTD